MRGASSKGYTVQYVSCKQVQVGVATKQETKKLASSRFGEGTKKALEAQPHTPAATPSQQGSLHPSD
jgi:hypothetical protein